MGHRLWLPAVAVHRLGVVEIAPSPHRCFRTAHPCAQSVKRSPTEPVLSRSSTSFYNQTTFSSDERMKLLSVRMTAVHSMLQTCADLLFCSGMSRMHILKDSSVAIVLDYDG